MVRRWKTTVFYGFFGSLILAGLFTIGFVAGNRYGQSIPENIAVQVGLIGERGAYEPFASGSGKFEPGQALLEANMPTLPELAEDWDWVLLVARLEQNSPFLELDTIQAQRQGDKLVFTRKLDSRPALLNWMFIRKKTQRY